MATISKSSTGNIFIDGVKFNGSLEQAKASLGSSGSSGSSGYSYDATTGKWNVPSSSSKSSSSSSSRSGSSSTPSAKYGPGQAAILTPDPTVGGAWTHTRADTPLFKTPTGAPSTTPGGAVPAAKWDWQTAYNAYNALSKLSSSSRDKAFSAWASQAGHIFPTGYKMPSRYSSSFLSTLNQYKPTTPPATPPIGSTPPVTSPGAPTPPWTPPAPAPAPTSRPPHRYPSSSGSRKYSSKSISDLFGGLFGSFGDSSTWRNNLANSLERD